MKDLVTFALTVFTGFFAIMNPIANAPVFLSLVQNQDQISRNVIARRATITAFLIVCIFTVAGKYIFDLFGITIPAFKIAGGVLIFYVGFEMLMSQQSKIHSANNAGDADNIAISPLGIPILAGPGTIVTAMNDATHADFIRVCMVVIVFAGIAFLNYLTFASSQFIIQKLGANLITVIGKIMGLILTIIGTQMIMQGLKLTFA